MWCCKCDGGFTFGPNSASPSVSLPSDDGSVARYGKGNSQSTSEAVGQSAQFGPTPIPRLDIACRLLLVRPDQLSIRM